VTEQPIFVNIDGNSVDKRNAQFGGGGTQSEWDSNSHLEADGNNQLILNNGKHGTILSYQSDDVSQNQDAARAQQSSTTSKAVRLRTSLILDPSYQSAT